MGLFDYVPPSERLADLALVVRRLKRHTGLSVIPMLVVEGRTDEPAWGSLCKLGRQGVFSAGTRALVEQMVALSSAQPITDCVCVYVVDCDGRGKTMNLAAREDLVVTQTCDLEADLVEIGVAGRVVAPFLMNDSTAATLVDRAKNLALPFSVVRRAAADKRVSMKLNGRQVRRADLSPAVTTGCLRTPPSDEQVIETVAEVLNWTEEERASVTEALVAVDREPTRCLMGKDILDALYELAIVEGGGNIRGWSRDHFHEKVLGALQPSDGASWIVAQRISAWAANCGLEFLLS